MHRLLQQRRCAAITATTAMLRQQMSWQSTATATPAAASTNSINQNDTRLDDEEAEEADIGSIVTAASIAKTLRNYRASSSAVAAAHQQEQDEQQQMMQQEQEEYGREHQQVDDVDNRRWVDLETLMSSKYVSRSSLGGEPEKQTPILRPLQTAEEIVAGSAVIRAAGLEMKPQLLVRLAMPPRAAHVFVDSDNLTPAQVASLLGRMQLLPEHSTVAVARQPATQPANFGKAVADITHMFNRSTLVQDDVIAQHRHVRTYMLVEKLAAKLSLAHTVVLNDVIFVCCDELFEVYCEHVALATPFLDADVYVHSPSRSDQVYSKQLLPTMSATLTAPPGARV